MASDSTSPNTLYYGDNLDILRRYIADESVDLIYLDPPFNSNADYNVLFAEHDGTPAHTQFRAFEDIWRWDTEAAANFRQAVEHDGRVSDVMRVFETFLGHYLLLSPTHARQTAAPRINKLLVTQPVDNAINLVELCSDDVKVLTVSGVVPPKHSVCDVIRKLNDARRARIDEERHFREISQNAPLRANDAKVRGKRLKTGLMGTFIEDQKAALTIALSLHAAEISVEPTAQILERHRHRIGGRIRRLVNRASECAGRVVRIRQHTEHRFEHTASFMNRHAFPRRLPPREDVGCVEFERTGIAWRECLRKRIELLSEVVRLRLKDRDSAEDEVVLVLVLCGTGVVEIEQVHKKSSRESRMAHRTASAALPNRRRIIGARPRFVNRHSAVSAARASGSQKRWFYRTFGPKIEKTYEVIGEPRSVPDAQQLAEENPFQFQCWALGLVGARPVVTKKGTDKGIDGRLFFHEGSERDGVKQVILSVKGDRNVTVKDVRDLIGVVSREKAPIGVLISMTKPTKPMKSEAAGAGFYNSPGHTNHPKIQILTIEDLLAGKTIDMPGWRTIQTFKKAPKAKKGKGEDDMLFRTERS